jgi:predicted Zn-dependent protease
VTLFEEPSPNAFALPGGKIGVHTGLLTVASNQSQLATVLGHEVAHVLAEHGNERISTAYATQTGLSVVESISGAPSPTKSQLLGLLGVGAQVGVLLPFGRAQEREADQLGLDLMARAGFDPTQSVALWRNMAKAGGGEPPEFMSTHPSHGTRIQDLEARMPGAVLLETGARERGRRPRCS